MKYGDLIRLIEKDGWLLARANGSHRIYKHSVKKGTAIVAPHSLNDDVPQGILSAVLKEVEIKI